MRLQSRFIALSVPAVALAMLSLGGVVYSQLVDARRTSLVSDVTLAAERVDIRVESFVREMQTSATLLANAASVEDWFKTPDGHFLKPVYAGEVTSLFDSLKLVRPRYRELRLFDMKGMEQVRVARSSLLNRSANERGSDWFSKLALNWWSPIHTSVGKSRDDGVTTVTVSRPVRVKLTNDAKIASLVGYVVIDARADEILSRFGNIIGNGGYIALLDADNQVIFAAEENKADVALIQQALLAKAVEQGSREFIGQIMVAGEARTVALQKINEGLSVVVVLPASAVHAVRSQVARVVGLVTLASIVVLSVFFAWLVHRIVVAPVTRLQSNINDLGEGRALSVRHAGRDDEIGQLMQSFVRMSDRLSSSMKQLNESNQRHEKLAYHDGLTGLPNRRKFHETLQSGIRGAERSGHRLAVMFLDLDKFKQLNDTQGHQAGDELLITTARRLERAYEGLARDLAQTHPELCYDVARLAGDEFVVLLGGFHDDSLVGDAAVRMLDELCQPAAVGDVQWPLIASAGVAIYPLHANTSETLLACADAAMYHAKQDKNPSWHVYQTGEDEPCQLVRAA